MSDQESDRPRSFGEILQRLRLAAGLTQEGLADRAGISPRAISDLERGARRYPRRDTLNLLADALELSAPERAEFEAAALRPARPAERRPPSDEVVAPYRGLRSFSEEDARFFFGREAFTEILVEAVSRRSFVAVVGPSGSGKSSVVQAGLLPRLRTGDAKWLTATLVPGQRPYHALAVELIGLLDPELTETQRLIEVTRMADALASRELSLSDVIHRVLELHVDYNRVLLVVDQWEELYTLVPDEEVRSTFIDRLLEATAEGEILSVVLTLRADFVGAALGYRPLCDRIQDAQVNLSTMTQEETEHAIVEPARVAGMDFEPGLVTRILQDVGTEPGTLPLLEFLLSELWEARSDGRLVHAAYEEMGGVRGAMAARADALFSHLDDEDQERVRRLMLHLVQPGEGTTDTRRRSNLDEVGGETESLVQLLTDARLLFISLDESTNEETVEIAHEALIQHWSRLQDWVNRDREFLMWRRRLTASVEQWQATGEDEDALLRGLALAEAQRWYVERPEDFWPEGRHYVERSLDLQRTSQDRARRRRRVLISVTAAVMLVVSALAVFAGLQWRNASAARSDSEQALAIAESRELAGRARIAAATQPQLALLLAAEAENRASTYESRNAMAQAAVAWIREDQPSSTPLNGHTGGVYGVAFSPDGRTLASSSFDETIRLWDVETAEQIGDPLTGQSGLIRSIAFSPDGQTLISGSWDETVRLWDVQSHQPLGGPLPGQRGRVYEVAFSPDGKLAAAATSEGYVELWDVATRQPHGEPMRVANDYVYSMAFSPDGHLLATGSGEETVRLWSVATGEPVGNPFIGHSSYVYDVTFSPDGKMLASGSIDGSVRLWDVASGTAIGEPISGSGAWVYSVTFSPDGSTLAFSTSNADIFLWSIGDRRAIGLPLLGHTGPVPQVAFSPDGKTLASGGGDGSVRLWSLDTASVTQEPITGHDDWVFNISYSPDGNILASASFDGTVRLWDPATGEAIGEPLVGHTDWVSSVKFSPDGKRLASASKDQTIRLWDVATHQPIGPPLVGHTGLVYGVAFSPNGEILASASQDGTVRLWNAETGQPIGESLLGHSDEVYAVAFNPDGTILASASLDGTIRFWNPETGEPLPDPLIGEPRGPIISIAFSPDGRTLAAGSLQQIIRLWDVESGKPIGAPLVGHAGWVYAVAFSPDGKTLASASSDDTVRLWDVATGRPLGDPLIGHRGGVSTVAFSPDGSTLASAGSDRSIRLWPNPSIEAVCQFATADSLLPLPSYLEGRISHWYCEDLESQ